MNDDTSEAPVQQNGETTAPSRSRQSETGVIKTYQAEKGFGFIAPDAGPDVFFHVTDLIDPNITVEVGQKVRFGLAPSKRKPGTFVAVEIQRYTA